MTDMINGRTPEEIKRWVDGRATCNTCPKEHEVGCEYGKRTEDCQMSIDTIAYIERLEAERDAALAKVPKWISVEERLPELGEWVVFRFLVGGNPEAVLYATGCYKEREYSSLGGCEWYTDDENYNCNLGHHEVTHWMPLHELLEVKHD